MKNKLYLFLLMAVPLMASISASKARDNAYELNKLITQGQTQAALTLITAGVDFDSGATSDTQYKRPLVWAATNGNLEVVKALIESGDKVRLALGRETALNMAVINLNFEMTEYLVLHGASPFQVYNNDITSFYRVVDNGYNRYILMFLKHMNKQERMQAFHYALKKNNTNLLFTLTYTKGYTHNLVDAKGKFLRKEVTRTDLPLDYQDEEGKTMLMYSVEAENTEFITHLLSLKADLMIKDNDGVSAKDRVQVSNNKAMYILFKDRDITEDDMAFIQAAKDGNLKKLKILLKKGVKIEGVDEHGSTALIHASAQNHPDVVKALLKAGASCNTKTSYGYTPVMSAGNNGAIDSAKVLLENKCYLDKNGIPEFKNHSNWTRNKYKEYFAFLDDYKVKHKL